MGIEAEADESGTYQVGPEEAALHSALLDVLERCRDLDPEWWANFEDTDVETCDRAELVSLMRTAPTESVKLFLFGKYQFRLAIAFITERGFT